MQFKQQEMKNNGYNGYIKWKTSVQKNLKEKELEKWENILHKNFTCMKIYLYRTCTRKLSIRYFSARKQYTCK
jgi:hypothetical protein